MVWLVNSDWQNIKIIVVIIVTIVTTSLIRKQFSHIANQILDFVYLLLTFVREDEPFWVSYDNKIFSTYHKIVFRIFTWWLMTREVVV